MRSRIPAGLLDSGFTALGTFVIGLYAVNTLDAIDPAYLGVYALFMFAFLFAGAVTTQVVFIPAEKVTLGLDAPQRVHLGRRTMRRGAPAAVTVAVVVSLAALIAGLQGTEAAVIVPMWVTAYVAAILTPIQDHLRRLLHLAERSWDAAVTSTVQLGAAVGFLVLFAATAPDPFWVPFGAIAASRATSSLVAWVLSRRAASSTSVDDAELGRLRQDLGYRSLWVSGRYLAATGALSTGNNLLVATIISSIAGQEVLGFAEAARTVSQPILVLANGLRAVLGPNSMEAGRTRDRTAARKVASVFYRLSIVLGAGYVALVGFDWALNPLAGLAEAAYVVGGLVIVTIIANLFNGAAFPNRFELIGADKESSLLGAEIRANLVQLGIATAMSFAGANSTSVGAMARPVAFAGLGVSRLALYRRPLKTHYDAKQAVA